MCFSAPVFLHLALSLGLLRGSHRPGKEKGDCQSYSSRFQIRFLPHIFSHLVLRPCGPCGLWRWAHPSVSSLSGQRSIRKPAPKLTERVQTGMRPTTRILLLLLVTAIPTSYADVLGASSRTSSLPCQRQSPRALTLTLAYLTRLRPLWLHAPNSRSFDGTLAGRYSDLRGSLASSLRAFTKRGYTNGHRQCNALLFACFHRHRPWTIISSMAHLACMHSEGSSWTAAFLSLFCSADTQSLGNSFGLQLWIAGRVTLIRLARLSFRQFTRAWTVGICVCILTDMHMRW